MSVNTFGERIMSEFKQQNAGSPVAESPGPTRMSDFELESILRQRPLGPRKLTFLCPACEIRVHVPVQSRQTCLRR